MAWRAEPMRKILDAAVALDEAEAFQEASHALWELSHRASKAAQEESDRGRRHEPAEPDTEPIDGGPIREAEPTP